MNRYERARRLLSRAYRERLQADFARLWRFPPDVGEAVSLHITGVEGPAIRCLVSLDPANLPGQMEQHVSISRPGTKTVPTWDDLVLVRALAWPDDVEVHQVFPALTGPDAEDWVSLPGVEVLHLRRLVSQ